MSTQNQRRPPSQPKTNWSPTHFAQFTGCPELALSLPILSFFLMLKRQTQPYSLVTARMEDWGPPTAILMRQWFCWQPPTLKRRSNLLVEQALMVIVLRLAKTIFWQGDTSRLQILAFTDTLVVHLRLFRSMRSIRQVPSELVAPRMPCFRGKGFTSQQGAVFSLKCGSLFFQAKLGLTPSETMMTPEESKVARFYSEKQRVVILDLCLLSSQTSQSREFHTLHFPCLSPVASLSQPEAVVQRIISSCIFLCQQSTSPLSTTLPLLFPSIATTLQPSTSMNQSWLSHSIVLIRFSGSQQLFASIFWRKAVMDQLSVWVGQPKRRQKGERSDRQVGITFYSTERAYSMDPFLINFLRQQEKYSSSCCYF